MPFKSDLYQTFGDPYDNDKNSTHIDSTRKGWALYARENDPADLTVRIAESRNVIVGGQNFNTSLAAQVTPNAYVTILTGGEHRVNIETLYNNQYGAIVDDTVLLYAFNNADRLDYALKSVANTEFTADDPQTYDVEYAIAEIALTAGGTQITGAAIECVRAASVEGGEGRAFGDVFFRSDTATQSYVTDEYIFGGIGQGFTGSSTGSGNCPNITGTFVNNVTSTKNDLKLVGVSELMPTGFSGNVCTGGISSTIRNTSISPYTYAIAQSHGNTSNIIVGYASASSSASIASNEVGSRTGTFGWTGASKFSGTSSPFATVNNHSIIRIIKDTEYNELSYSETINTNGGAVNAIVNQANTGFTNRLTHIFVQNDRVYFITDENDFYEIDEDGNFLNSVRFSDAPVGFYKSASDWYVLLTNGYVVQLNSSLSFVATYDLGTGSVGNVKTYFQGLSKGFRQGDYIYFQTSSRIVSVKIDFTEAYTISSGFATLAQQSGFMYAYIGNTFYQINSDLTSNYSHSIEVFGDLQNNLGFFDISGDVVLKSITIALTFSGLFSQILNGLYTTDPSGYSIVAGATAMPAATSYTPSSVAYSSLSATNLPSFVQTTASLPPVSGATFSGTPEIPSQTFDIFY